MSMDRGLKERLVGAAVLVALAVIFIPMLLDDAPPGPGPITESNIPDRPVDDGDGFSSRIVPIESESVDLELPPAVEPAAPEEQAAGERDAADDDTVVAEKADEAKTPDPEPEAPAPAPAAEQRETAQSAEEKPTGWVVQLGSFAQRDNAEELISRLQAENFAAFVETVQRSGQRVYRVRVGPEVLRSEAEKLRDRIGDDLELEGIVVSYP